MNAIDEILRDVAPCVVCGHPLSTHRYRMRSRDGREAHYHCWADGRPAGQFSLVQPEAKETT